MKNHYKTLGIQRGSNTALIRKTYRRLALQHHPDRVSPEFKKDAETRFKDIVEAYYVLGHAQRRQVYDAQYSSYSNGYSQAQYRNTSARQYRQSSGASKETEEILRRYFEDRGFDDFVQKEWQDFQFQPTDWSEILGNSRKAKGLAIFLALLLFFLPGNLSLIGHFLFMPWAWIGFLYIVFPGLRFNDNLLEPLYLIASWILLIFSVLFLLILRFS